MWFWSDVFLLQLLCGYVWVYGDVIFIKIDLCMEFVYVVDLRILNRIMQ